MSNNAQLTLRQLFCHLSDGMRKSRFRAVLFGGFALPVYGVERLTLDIDVMLQDGDFPAFEAAMTPYSYACVYRSPQYAKFRTSPMRLPDVDTVFTDPTPFAAIWQDVTWQPVMGVPFPVASLRIMLATKLHALRYNAANRTRKNDLPDIVALLQANNIAPRDAWFRELCEAYGTVALWENICQQTP
ncbi:MAG: hypothetical protein A3K19_08740 [Lentisphaerae bacterium RIFOXYB12_FULL_65_16]|nr:MAG: hypothetical protein A3K18_02665 [Lentisphaerae bacterium RIFOXYA12_64_32]OGV86019.1 MAG: hypothetical protein A3K19_08740 [Lentisphaerae bacterium RIFOXYB12_FULL_65_16]